MEVLSKSKSIQNINKDLLTLFILLAVAAFLRPIPYIGGMGLDETSYAFLIKHFVDGTFLDDYIFIAFHPFYSFIASPLAAIGINPELAGRIVSYFFGVASVISVYFIGQLLFSRTAGFIAGFMTATFPVLIKWSGIVQAQTTYSFMLLMSMLFSLLFLKRFKLYYAILAGVFISFAYLSRAEGLGIFFGNVLMLLIFWFKKSFDRKPLIGAVLFIVSFLIVASPYVYALRLKTGQTKFTNKLYTQIRAAVIVDYDLDYEKYNYGKADIPKGEVLKMAIKVYPKKIVEAFTNFPDYFGYLALFLAVLPLLFLFFETVSLAQYLFFLPYLYVLIILPFFFLSENYFIPYAPFIFLLSGNGAELFENVFQKRIKKSNVPFILAFVLLLITYENVIHDRVKTYFQETKPGINKQTIIYNGYRDFGKEIAPLIPKDSKIMTRFNIGAWYANGEYVSIPDVNWQEFLLTLDKQKVDYIIVGPAEMDMREELYNELFWRIKGIVKDNRFSLVKRTVTPYYLEFYLIKVNR